MEGACKQTAAICAFLSDLTWTTFVTARTHTLKFSVTREDNR